MPLRVLNRIYREKEPKKVPQETLGGPLDVYFTPGEPEKPKEPAPLTHLKVGDIVHIEIGNWQELGDYAKVVAVDGEQLTVEGIEPKHQGRKVFNERHFLTFSMGWGDHPGDSKKYPGSYYFFHFAMVPPADILALGLKRYEEATGSDEYRKYYNLFNYFAPEEEFKPKAKELDEALLRHHFYSPHGVDIEELFHGVKPLPRKAWELEPVYMQDNVGAPRIHDEWGVRYVPAEKRSGLRPTVFTYPDRQSAMNGKQFHDRHIDPREWEPGVVEPLGRKGQAAVGIARELKDLSPAARNLLRTRTGYRCETAYGEGYRNAFDVLEHEVLELGNSDMVNEAEEALGLPKTEDLGGDLAPPLHAIREAIERKFGKDAKVLWLASRSGVKWYCDGGEPDEYEIPKDALIISDLGAEGQLFLMTGEAARKVGAA